MPERAFISIVMPCRNEATVIARTIDSLIAQDYPKKLIEILVIDGMSDDGTREILSMYCHEHPNLKQIDNPQKAIPSGLNLGIRYAKGDYIIRVDAHSTYPTNYISRLISWHKRLDADNVGGVCVTVPGSQTRIAEAIAYVLSVPFGVGNALFRTGIRTPTEVDTVPFGCFRRSVFTRVGIFDESMARTEDDEFNARLKKAGGRIYLVPDVTITYYARDTIPKLLQMMFQYGYFKPLVAVKHGRPSSFRQLAPPFLFVTLLLLAIVGIFFPLFAASACAIITLHLLCGLVASLSLAKRRGVFCGLIAVCLFLLTHLSYGAGYFKSMLDLAVFRPRAGRVNVDVPITR